ncbi:MAG: permease [Vulcanimicrobiota bacterium]
MKDKKELKTFIFFLVVFLAIIFMPIQNDRFKKSIIQSFMFLNKFAQNAIPLGFIPAFFLAGAINVFVNKAAILKYLGGDSKKWIAYSVASLAGTVLTACSCTVIPIFAGIYKRGAGLGPAISFLYSGPAINVLAIVITARILGPELGIARFVGAVGFAVVIGLIMQLLFKQEEQERRGTITDVPLEEDNKKWWQYGLFFLSLVGIIIFAKWPEPNPAISGAAQNALVGFSMIIYKFQWYLLIASAIILIVSLVLWFSRKEVKEWGAETWNFAKMILPLLFWGVLISGFLFGVPKQLGGIIPREMVMNVVGDNSLKSNFLASFMGALVYFATLTEVPILQVLLGAGMAKGPALALLLAGPALSLPNILVIQRVIGTKKTAVYLLLVIIMSTLAGLVYGSFFA